MTAMLWKTFAFLAVAPITQSNTEFRLGADAWPA